jgi:acyl-CoA reductase-like NAD-dependent aldehyde dehydrogenase
MKNETTLIMPDTPSSVLALFGTSKAQIESFVTGVIREVENGNADALKVEVYAKTLEEIAKKLREQNKEFAKTEAAKYGEKPFEFSGAELQFAPTYTSYDYSKCGDLIYDDLVVNQKSYTQLVKEREEFLKKVKEPFRVVNESTGETFVVNPPVKKVSMGVKVTIK